MSEVLVGIPIGNNCAPFAADLFNIESVFVYLSDNNQADAIELVNSTSRWLDDLLNIENPYFKYMVMLNIS